jgi:hypothetical protein
MDPLQSFLLSLVVLFPCISGLIRWKKIRQMYRPFIILVTVAAMTEVLNYIIIEVLKGNNNSIINIYSLAEWTLLIAQFYYWRYYSHTRRWYPYIGLACVIVWIVENLIIGNISHIGPVFRISSAFIMVTLSINEINYVIINESRNLLKNARFLICAGFLVYFLYQVLLEGVIYVTAKGDSPTANKIINLFSYINAFVNIIYGIAVWYIPKKISLEFRRESN